MPGVNWLKSSSNSTASGPEFLAAAPRAGVLLETIHAKTINTDALTNLLVRILMAP
jgi:hypothetical protein